MVAGIPGIAGAAGLAAGGVAGRVRGIGDAPTGALGKPVPATPPTDTLSLILFKVLALMPGTLTRSSTD